MTPLVSRVQNQTDRVLADRSTVIPYRLNQEVVEKYMNLLMIIYMYYTGQSQAFVSLYNAWRVTKRFRSQVSMVVSHLLLLHVFFFILYSNIQQPITQNPPISDFGKVLLVCNLID